MSTPRRMRMWGRSVGAAAVLTGALAVAAFVYTATGGAARDLLVQELLVNLILVVGFQVFIGSTGILSFGHLAFSQIAAYGVALTAIPAATKASRLPDLPFGLGDVELGPFPATIVGVVVAVVVGAAVGVAVARAGGLAATMITLAVLFVVDQVVKNWTEMTRGAGGLSGIPRLTGNGWLWLAAFGALIVGNAFRESRVGRFAVASREDEIAASAIGINLFWPRWVAWVVSIAIVATAGALRVQMIGSTSPQQYTLDVGVLVLAMLVAGGMRTVTGAFVGTVIITVGNEISRQLGDHFGIERLPELFLGGALLLVMLARPDGLLADHDLAAWWRHRWPDPAVAEGGDIDASAAEATATAPAGTPAGHAGGLVAEGIEVRFGGFQALDEAGVRVRPGEVVGLIGPNGAGKTTLFNVVTGIVEEDAGRVTLGDRDLTDAPPHTVARAGLARTFQNLRLFPRLSVRENVELAAISARRYRPDAPAVDVDELLRAGGLEEYAERAASTLDYGNQRRLELARAAALRPAYLLLDEPTSGMSDQESADMVDHVRATARLVGAGVLVIDHDLAFITRISDHIVVLAEGRVIAEGRPDEIRHDPVVAAAYLGQAQPVE